MILLYAFSITTSTLMVTIDVITVQSHTRQKVTYKSTSMLTFTPAVQYNFVWPINLLNNEGQSNPLTLPFLVTASLNVQYFCQKFSPHGENNGNQNSPTPPTLSNLLPARVAINCAHSLTGGLGPDCAQIDLRPKRAIVDYRDYLIKHLAQHSGLRSRHYRGESWWREGTWCNL